MNVTARRNAGKMKHLGTKVLETKRLILRPFTISDAPAMYKNWASDDEVTKFLTWPSHASVQVSEEVIADWVSHYEEGNYYSWAIVCKENGAEPIGSIAAVSQNEQIRTAEIGYCMGKSWWGKGIMAEALVEVIRFFMEEVEFNRVSARHDANNPNSGKVMQKSGMHYVGIMRQADMNNQGICDAVYYELLAEDYFS